MPARALKLCNHFPATRIECNARKQKMPARALKLDNCDALGSNVPIEPENKKCPRGH